MARVVLVGLESATAGKIDRALANDLHEVRHKPETAELRDVSDADIVFAGGQPAQYLALLKGVRRENPDLPFVVVTRLPETHEWLDALEAGATDYCSAPFETRQIQWLMESALSRRRATMAA